VHLETLKEVEEKAKSTIQAIQEKIDESAKEKATQNAAHLKQKQQMEEKYQTKIAELEVFIFTARGMSNGIFRPKT
jgi:septal ring factor EnvC (AmiA/AmiB activator)